MNKDNKSKKELELKKEEPNMHTAVIISIIMAVILLFAAVGVFVYANQQKAEEVESTDVTEEVIDTSDIERYEDYTAILYEGTAYEYNTDIKTVLFLGIDQLDGTEEEAGTAGRSDTMILLIVDSANEMVTMLSVSRDTIAEVYIANSYGETIMKADMHLALQYSYGDGGKTSCVLSREAVSRLFYDIPIDYYMSMNLDGLSGVINAIGGLTVTLEDDYTYIDERLIQGETVTMDGDLAESFVRYRDITELGSNDDRMERQEVFLEAFFAQMKSAVGSDTSSMETMWNLMSNYLTTDLNFETIEKLASYEMNEESYKVPGETVEGVYHDEYIVDENNLLKMLVELLYIEK